MGLGSSSGNLIYVNIKDGRFYVKKDNEITFHEHLHGYLREIRIDKDKYKEDVFDVLILYITDGADKFLVKMKFGSSYCVSFCMAIGNADLTKKMVLLPSMKTENGKEKRTMFISQKNPEERGGALKWTWTKDNPGDLPPLVKVRINGKDQWDAYDQNEYLKEYLIQVIAPRIPHELMQGPANEATPHIDPGAATPKSGLGVTPAGIKPEDMTEPIDDLPF